jgi:hypothetical protein
VPENRSVSGRQIPINVIVLRATKFGGPGERTVSARRRSGPGQHVDAAWQRFSAVAGSDMDMVLMDQRGTGGSTALVRNGHHVNPPRRSATCAI